MLCSLIGSLTQSVLTAGCLQLLEILEISLNLVSLRRYLTSGSAIAEGPRDVLVSRNSATTKYRYRVALFV